MTEEWTFDRGATFTGDFLPKLMPHYRQGDVDYACGFYCLAMIFEYFEITPAKDAQQWLTKQLSSLGTSSVIGSGLYQNELGAIIKNDRYLSIHKRSPRPINFQSTRDFVECIAGEGIPGILFYRIEDEKMGHYAVTVGAGKDKIFLKDPAKENHVGSLYNNYLERLDDCSVLDDSNRYIPKIGTCIAITRLGFRLDQELFRLPRQLTDQN